MPGTARLHRQAVAGTICPAISQPDAAADLVDYDAAIESAISVAIEAMVELKAQRGHN